MRLKGSVDGSPPTPRLPPIVTRESRGIVTRSSISRRAKSQEDGRQDGQVSLNRDPLQVHLLPCYSARLPVTDAVLLAPSSLHRAVQRLRSSSTQLELQGPRSLGSSSLASGKV